MKHWVAPYPKCWVQQMNVLETSRDSTRARTHTQHTLGRDPCTPTQLTQATHKHSSSVPHTHIARTTIKTTRQATAFPPSHPSRAHAHNSGVCGVATHTP